ncbi:hypothetical protein ACNS7O_00220 [Haloferacaceae archaeon DSL9]
MGDTRHETPRAVVEALFERMRSGGPARETVGDRFEGVRYVDISETDRDSMPIERLGVWNDLAVDGVVSVDTPGPRSGSA